MLLKASRYGLAAVLVIATWGGLSFVKSDDKSDNKRSSDSTPHYRAKQILGSKVNIEGDLEVGTVDDIVLDEDGNVDYLIVANADKKLVTVPWDAAKFNTEKRSTFIPIAPEKYKQVPTYTVEKYPLFSTPTYRTDTYRYYGLTPGQERRMIRRGALR